MLDHGAAADRLVATGLIPYLRQARGCLPHPALTNEPDGTTNGRRRYRRRRKDGEQPRPEQTPAPAAGLGLEALRDAREAEGLNNRIPQTEYDDSNYYQDSHYQDAHASDQGLRNPYLVAGIAVAAAVVLAVLVVVLFGGSGDAGGRGVLTEALGTGTPQAGNGRGISARTIAATTVREGPGVDENQLATLPAGQEVEVIGRNGDSTWFQIYYPPGSQLKGWVPGAALRLDNEDVARLAVVSSSPVPRATTVRPTEAPAPAATPSATAVPQPTATPEGGGADVAIAVQTPSCIPGTSLTVTVRNAGAAPLSGRNVQVTIANAGGVVGTQSLPLTATQPGATMTLLTGVPAQAPSMTASVTLLGSPPDANPGNNVAECTSGAVSPPATPVPPAATAIPRPATPVPQAPPVVPRVPPA